MMVSPAKREEWLVQHDRTRELEAEVERLRLFVGSSVNALDQLLVAFGHHDNGPTRAARKIVQQWAKELPDA